MGRPHGIEYVFLRQYKDVIDTIPFTSFLIPYRAEIIGLF